MTPESFADPRDALRQIAPLRSLDHAEIDTVHDVMRALHVAAGTDLMAAKSASYPSQAAFQRCLAAGGIQKPMR